MAREESASNNGAAKSVMFVVYIAAQPVCAQVTEDIVLGAGFMFGTSCCMERRLGMCIAPTQRRLWLSLVNRIRFSYGSLLWIRRLFL